MGKLTPKNVSPFDDEIVTKRILKIKNVIDSKTRDIKNCKVFISEGNTKTGIIRSVSLPPVLFCTNCNACRNECYVVRNIAWRPSVIDKWAQNGALLKKVPDRFFNDIERDIDFHGDKFFRWHVSGDIISDEHLSGMVRIAKKFRFTKFLCFTKSYNIVNDWVRFHGMPPKNLIIIFSRWQDLLCENVYFFPEAHVIRSVDDIGDTVPDGTRLCTGNCTNCAMGLNEHGWKGCWTLKRGSLDVAPDCVGFPIH